MNATGAPLGASGTTTAAKRRGMSGRSAALRGLSIPWALFVSTGLSAAPPAAPQLLPEPALTAGTGNLVQWTPLIGDVEYRAQCAEDEAFTVVPLDSGWIPDDRYLFSSLLPNTTYWYRVKARMPAEVQAWQQTSRADFETDLLDDVSIDAAPDDVVLIDGSVPRKDVLGSDALNASRIQAMRLNAFRCDADRTLTAIEHFLGLAYSMTMQFRVYESTTLAGPYQLAHMNETLSGTVTGWHGSGPISVPLSAGKYYAIGVAWNGSVSIYHRAIDAEEVSWGTRVGTGIAGMPWPDQITCSPEAFSYYQRLTTVRPAGYVPSGRMISTAVSLPAGQTWGAVRFAATTPSDTSIAVDVLDGGADAPLLTNVTSGTRLDNLDTSAIRLRAILATTNPARTPVLHDWAVTVVDPAGGGESDWSDLQSSTQCAPSPQDLDGDCDVDADDLRAFEACASGPAVPYDPGNLPAGCPLAPDAQNRIPADADRDGDVDLVDFAVFQRCHAGPDRLPDPSCADGLGLHMAEM